ncbi:hypothetical protein COK11_16320 [Priestia megaterium]|nr:hypothetical protein COK11_16320 [Priestia megaterium]
MQYFEISIPKAILIVSEEEVLRLVKQDTDMFALALKRGKHFKRAEKQRRREQDKFDQEGTQ